MFILNGVRRGVPDSYRLSLPQWSASASKDGLGELLKDRPEGHHGTTPIEAHLGERTIKGSPPRQV